MYLTLTNASKSPIDVEPQTNIGIDELPTTHNHTNSRCTHDMLLEIIIIPVTSI